MKTATSTWIKIAGLIGLAVVIENALNRPRPPATVSSRPKKVQTPPPDWRYISRAEGEVRKQLREPDSAVFTDVYVSHKAGVPATCGRVNSRNGFGGMTGPQRFISGAVTAIEESVEDGAMDEIWSKVC